MKNHEIVEVYQLSSQDGELYWGCMKLLGVQDYPTFTELTNEIQKLGYEIVSMWGTPFLMDAVLKDCYKMLVRR